MATDMVTPMAMEAINTIVVTRMVIAVIGVIAAMKVTEETGPVTGMAIVTRMAIVLTMTTACTLGNTSSNAASGCRTCTGNSATT